MRCVGLEKKTRPRRGAHDLFRCALVHGKPRAFGVERASSSCSLLTLYFEKPTSTVPSNAHAMFLSIHGTLCSVIHGLIDLAPLCCLGNFDLLLAMLPRVFSRHPEPKNQRRKEMNTCPYAFFLRALDSGLETGRLASEPLLLFLSSARCHEGSCFVFPSNPYPVLLVITPLSPVVLLVVRPGPRDCNAPCLSSGCPDASLPSCPFSCGARGRMDAHQHPRSITPLPLHFRDNQHTQAHCLHVPVVASDGRGG